jgi:hypothetical protein
VLRAILTSPDFYAPTVFRSKVKSPFELAASALRALDADTSGAPALHDWIRRMGQPLYQHQAPTGYKETSQAWVNTGIFINRVNFLGALAAGQIPGTRFDASRLISTSSVSDAEVLTSKLAALLLHTDLSAEGRRAIRASLNQPQPRPAVFDTEAVRSARGNNPAVMTTQAMPDQESARHITQVISLLLGSTEFQRR